MSVWPSLIVGAEALFSKKCVLCEKSSCHSFISKLPVDLLLPITCCNTCLLAMDIRDILYSENP